MTSTHLRQRLRAGERVFGTLIVSPSPRWPDAVRDCGLDFVFIDTEHIALDRAQLSWMCQAYTALGLPERYDHPDFLAACETIFQKARAAGAGAGIHFWGEIRQQAHFLQLGANMLVHSADVTLFQKHLRAELEAIRQAAGLEGEISCEGVGFTI